MLDPGDRTRPGGSWEDMELSTSELSIYDKLSETIDLGLVTLGVVLLTAYFMIQPYTLSPSENTLTKTHPWGSLFYHIRLLPLPITKKYMLERCPEWWSLDCRRNMSLPAKCSCCCSMKTLVAPVDIRQLSGKNLQGQPLLIKTEQYRSYAEMKHFQSLYPELTNFVIQEEAAELWSSPPKQQPPFPVFWQNPQNKSQILQEIFPIFSSLLFPKDISLKSCFLIHHPRLQDKTYRLQNTFVVGSGRLNLYVIPSLLCREHCKTLMVELEAGDIGFTNVDYWATSFNSRGSEPVVVCDGSAG
ncbi:hypothetical protein L345_09757 [Ophiophagus hannah]|uniref:Uncharacterized protein n=1 Tax=Ophiophagus hannah TaxID=8665 RepID=V8NQF1_OPHHA|nr:hypothetical protein L345_09757 [Ophiophagus hannah]